MQQHRTFAAVSDAHEDDIVQSVYVTLQRLCMSMSREGVTLRCCISSGCSPVMELFLILNSYRSMEAYDTGSVPAPQTLTSLERACNVNSSYLKQTAGSSSLACSFTPCLTRDTLSASDLHQSCVGPAKAIYECCCSGITIMRSWSS